MSSMWWALPFGLGAAAAVAAERKSAVTPPGSEKKADTKALEMGAQALQRSPPTGAFDLYLVGFHPMKDAPRMQMEAHHFCRQVNEDFAQCVLFDGNGKDAKLNGLEYIISEALFEGLPAAEKAYWHPHNYEILSGELVAPGLPDAAEKAALRKKVNSYGKTWHVWMTHGDRLPLGPAHLAWSFNRDGELDRALLDRRDADLGIDTGEKRRNRADLATLARPQQGVRDLAPAFPAARGAPKGVDGKGPLGGTPRCAMTPPGEPGMGD